MLLFAYCRLFQLLANQYLSADLVSAFMTNVTEMGSILKGL